MSARAVEETLARQAQDAVHMESANTAPVHNFKKTNAAALAEAGAVLAHWLPDGKQQGCEYLALNPTRNDGALGSFSINTKTGVWADFSTDVNGAKGGDLISLVAYLDGCGQGEAREKLDEFLRLPSKRARDARDSVTSKHNGKKYSSLSAAEGVTRLKKGPRDKRDTLRRNDPPIPGFKHPGLGFPSKVWPYHDEQGRPLFFVCRFDIPGKGKEIRPLTCDGARWQWKAAPEPRPLYNLHTLTERPGAPVVITEGEKAADAAAKLFPDCITTTTPGGAKAPEKCDLSPLNGRRVLIWPDNDEPGAKYADKVAALAHQAGAASVAVLKLDKLPGAPLPEKADAADVKLTKKRAAALLTDADAWCEIKPDEGPAMPAGFSLEPRGLYHRSFNSNNAPVVIWICSPLQITAMIRDAHGNAWGRLLEFPDQDGKLHRVILLMEALAGDGSEYRRLLLSHGLRIATNPAARQRFAEYLQAAPVTARARCVTKIGWHNGVFVLHDETLGENGERVLLQSLHEPALMTTAGTLDGWRENVAALCVDNSRLTLAVSAAFAAPLLDITGDDSGGLNFQGASSTGKTTALNAAVSVWGEEKYLQRWRATTNGLEATALTHNDALLCLDELAQVDAREVGETAYMLANGSGKQRAKQDGLAKPKASWRLLFLSSGEIGLAQHMLEGGRKARAGQEVRLVDVPADAGAGYGLFENLHGYPDGAALSDAIREAARTHYGHAAREYLAALVAMNRDKLRERLRALRAGFTRAALPANADGQVVRVCDRFALVAAGGELAIEMSLTGWALGAATAAARKCFQAWIDHRGGVGAREEKAALEQVAQFFELHGESRFSSLDIDSTPEVRTINRAGFRQHVDCRLEYFVLTESWRAEVCKGIDPTYTARLCVQHGLIKPDSEGKPTSTHRLGDMGRQRVYHFVKTTVRAEHDPAKQCEASTATGSRCKRKAKDYHHHTDGEDYAVCALHQKSFTPCDEVTPQIVSRVSRKH
jgi:putative DNA primase/helicase